MPWLALNIAVGLLLFKELIIAIKYLFTILGVVLRGVARIFGFINKKVRPALEFLRKRKTAVVAEYLVRRGYRCLIIFLVRLVVFPIRTYFHPTVHAFLLVVFLLWLLTAGSVWVVETLGYMEAGSRTLTSPESFLDSLIRVAIYLVSSGLENSLPRTFSGKVVVILSVIVFLVLFALFTISYRERRERIIQRRLRTLPRTLPMFGHILVTGDISSVRMLLHQFDYYGVNQDIVVATENATTAALVGLRQFEATVWAVDGNLWEYDVMRQARVRSASELLVLGSSLDAVTVLRTVLSVEREQPLVRTSVDASSDDSTIFDRFLSTDDIKLDWESRAQAFKEDIERIPFLCDLLMDLVSSKKRKEPPRDVVIVRRLFKWRVLRSAPFGERDDQIANYAYRKGVVPLDIGTKEIRSSSQDHHFEAQYLLCIQCNDKNIIVRFICSLVLYFWCKVIKRKKDTADETGSIIEFQKVCKTLEDNEKVIDDTGCKYSVASSKKNATSDNKILRSFIESDWERPLLIKFSEPDSSLAMRYIHERDLDNMEVLKECDSERVESYSDLEMRTLFLSVCMLTEGAALAFLDKLWPKGQAERRIEFVAYTYSGNPISYRRLMSYKLLKGISLIAYRKGNGERWIPCSVTDKIRKEYQLLFIKNSDLNGPRNTEKKEK
jgi:hypothetical protein